MSQGQDEAPSDHRLEVIAAEVAAKAATIVRGAIGSASVAGTKSSATDVVTQVDIDVEEFIRGELTGECNGSSFVGEELGHEAGSSGIGWIVDPIDGTVNFLYDLPVVAVSIAATNNGEIVAGAVSDVLRGETFTARKGGGARRAGGSISVSDQRALALSLVATGFSYDAELRAEQAATIARLLPLARDIRCMGSAALNLCWVACGRLEAYYERDLKVYDHAAGALIAAEAGAEVITPVDGNSDLVAAAAPHIWPELRPIIDEHAERGEIPS